MWHISPKFYKSLWFSNDVFCPPFFIYSFFVHNSPQKTPYPSNIHCCCWITEFIHYTSASFKSHIDCKAGLYLRGGQGSVFQIRVTPIIFFTLFRYFSRLHGVHTYIGFIRKVYSKRACCFRLFLPLFEPPHPFVHQFFFSPSLQSHPPRSADLLARECGAVTGFFLCVIPLVTLA